jgi:Na+-driven multidrug efflux pump
VFGVVSRVLVFITIPLNGIGQGVQAIAGYNQGAGNQRRITLVVNAGYVFSVAFGLCLFVLLFFFPRAVLSFFTDSGRLVSAAMRPLSISTSLVALMGIQLVTYFYYISVHDVAYNVVTAICRQLLFIVPFLIVLPLFAGMDGVWWSFPAADFISAVFCVLFRPFVEEDEISEYRRRRSPGKGNNVTVINVLCHRSTKKIEAF